MSLMAGTDRRLPVHHKAPPRRAKGGVEGKPRWAPTPSPANQTAQQKKNWNAIPFPVSQLCEEGVKVRVGVWSWKRREGKGGLELCRPCFVSLD